MKCIVPLVTSLLMIASASAQITQTYYNADSTWNGLAKDDWGLIGKKTTIASQIWRNGGTIYRHTNAEFIVVRDDDRGTGWLTEFNGDEFGLIGNPGVNVDFFLYQDHNIISGNGIITFDTVYFNIGLANKMDITNYREPYVGYPEPFLGQSPGGIMVTKHLYFNNGLTTTNRAYPVNGAIVFINNAGYSNTTALSDAQHVDGFVTEVNNENHPGAPGHGGQFVFPVGNSTEVYQLVRNGLLTGDDSTLTVGWVDGDPNTTPDLTGVTSGGSGTINATDPSHLAVGIQSVVGVGFWDWQYQDMFDVNGAATAITSGDQTITVSIPDLSAFGVSATNLRLVGYNSGTAKWENLSGTNGASGITKGSTLTGVIPTGTTITALAIGSISVVLPVEFKDFSVKVSNCKALLEWKTQMEFNNSHFNVERSQDAVHFTTIARVNSAGNSTTLKTYNYIDDAPLSGKSYYRITQVDFDGKYTSTPMQAIEMNCDNSALKVFPNPAVSQVTIQAKKAIVQVNILSSNGQVVMRHQPSSSQATGIFSLNVQSLQSGIYMMQIINKDGTTDIIKLLKK